MNTNLKLKDRFEKRFGYRNAKLLSETGVWAGCADFLYTCAICVELDDYGYSYRYCYEKREEAEEALRAWEGSGDPPGPWIKLKGHPAGDRLGPGARGSRAFVRID